MPDTTNVPGTGTAQAMSAPAPAGNLLKLVIAWAWVGIPAVWGIAQVAIKSLALFK